jgi:uncharacterized protein (TIGR03067 family)
MTDYDCIQGMWQVQRLEQDGKPAADAPLLKLVLFKDDKICFRYFFPRRDGFEYGDTVFVFRLDASKRPKVIQTTYLEDGTVHFGIYYLEGETLQLCWNRDSTGDLPTAFATDTDSNRRLMVLERWQDKPG